MNENKQPGQTFSQIPEEEKRLLDPETSRFKNLLNPLLEKHDQNLILKYIEQDTGGTVPSVVEKWFSGEHTPSPTIRRGIVSALQNFTPEDLPAVEKIRLSTPKPEIQKIAEASLLKKSRLPRLTAGKIMVGNDEQLKGMLEVDTKRRRNQRAERILEKIKKLKEMKRVVERLKKEGKIL